MKSLFSFVLSALSLGLQAQDTIQEVKPKIELSGFIDTYYSYNFDKNKDKTIQNFQYNYNRFNELNINIALLKASVTYKNVYGKVAVHAGTYVDDNYASEDLKIINEAFVGAFLNSSKRTSIEAGILPSYIGFESAVTHSNVTATRSILAENSPYFMTGLKLNHQFNSKFSGAFLVTNGWQRIKKADNRLAPSFGTQIVYKPSENSTINWSTFIGKEYNGIDFTMRYFNNLYWDKAWNDKWRTITGFDFGIQDISSNNNEHHNWLSPILITQYSISNKWQMAHRIEYYQDKNNVIITFNLPFETLGNSINLDFLPNSKFKIRTEAKWFQATETIFDNNSKKDSFTLTTTMSFEF